MRSNRFNINIKGGRIHIEDTLRDHEFHYYAQKKRNSTDFELRYARHKDGEAMYSPGPCWLDGHPQIGPADVIMQTAKTLYKVDYRP